MNGLGSAFVAYAVVFFGIFVFTWMMSSKQSRLEQKLDELKEELRETRK